MKSYRVGILGATGMVGQRFATLLENHPWFHVTVLAASASSAGKTYREAAGHRWAMQTPMPESMADMIVMDASKIDEIAPLVDFVFCAVAMKNEEILALEQAYAKAEIQVISNNKTHRGFDDVPMVVPELNADHVDVIPTQRKRLGTKKGFVAVKSNCSIQSYVPTLTPLKDKYGLTKVLACTYQAISGAGKTFERWPEMIDNVIPYIGGEEEKSEKEPLKIWGKVVDGHIVNDDKVAITVQCLRVPVSDGHMAAVFASFEKKPSIEEIKKEWASYAGPMLEVPGKGLVPMSEALPSAPKQFIYYFEEPDRPQTRLDRNLENGMAVSAGRLREDSQYDIKFVCLSHNTLRGAAGGGVELAELLAVKGYLD